MHAGTQLLARLVVALELPGWSRDLLPTYSGEELKAIDRGLGRFQRLADDVGREERGEGQGSTYFHPDAAAEIRRTIAGEELKSYADRLWQFEDELPGEWKLAVSAYFKAWAAVANPSALQNLGELLVRAGQLGLAREAFNVILKFPSYASNLYGKDAPELSRMIVGRARESLGELDKR
jgi:hypothetical protein